MIKMEDDGWKTNLVDRGNGGLEPAGVLNRRRRHRLHRRRDAQRND